MSRPRKYPFHDLAPGESVLVPWPDGQAPGPDERLRRLRERPTSVELFYHRLTRAVYAATWRHRRKYSIRSLTTGVLISRLEDRQ